MSSLILSLFTLIGCNQEKMVFYPDKLPQDFKYNFNSNYEEINIDVDDSIKINSLLFKSDSSKGLVFYLHGNAGALNTWGEIAELYTDNNYDFFILDYRGFGKSQGNIDNEKQLHSDIQLAYNTIKKKYKEEDIVIIGFSIGTGLATKLAANNNPNKLILKAPYYNMSDLVHQYYKIIPSFALKFKLKTNKFITNVKCPITIFHGDIDEVINISSSIKLKPLLKENDELIVLKGQLHNGINNNPIYQKRIKQILN